MNNAKAIVAVGTAYENGKIKTFTFDDAVNRNPGIVTIPYPLKAFIVVK